MQADFDVNPAFDEWRSSTGSEKEWKLQELIRRLERFATIICWQRLPDHKDEFGPLVNRIVWRAIEKAHLFTGKSKFSTWFYRLAVNGCNTFLRDHLEKRETSLEEEMPARSGNIDAKIDFEVLFGRLKGRDRLLFQLVAEGQDFKSIGRALDISRNAAVVRWNRLKEKLRDASV